MKSNSQYYQNSTVSQCYQNNTDADFEIKSTSHVLLVLLLSFLSHGGNKLPNSSSVKWQLFLLNSIRFWSAHCKTASRFLRFIKQSSDKTEMIRDFVQIRSDQIVFTPAPEQTSGFSLNKLTQSDCRSLLACWRHQQL